MIPVGKMDRCITLQQQTESRGTDGSYSKTWGDVYKVRAAYNYKGGGETFEGDQETAVRTIKWTTRYLSGVDETWRIKHGADLYDIINVEFEGRKGSMTLHSIKKSVYQEK
jgi:SPP1 family predicted phage head-tail adaptor